jgi:hypothetical protein
LDIIQIESQLAMADRPELFAIDPHGPIVLDAKVDDLRRDITICPETSRSELLTGWPADEIGTSGSERGRPEASAHNCREATRPSTPMGGVRDGSAS